MRAVFHQCTHPMVASSTASVDSQSRLEWMSSALRNDQNLWMVLGGVNAMERTFPRKIS